jgi:hypothetical protein
MLSYDAYARTRAARRGSTQRASPYRSSVSDLPSLGTKLSTASYHVYVVTYSETSFAPCDSSPEAAHKRPAGPLSFGLAVCSRCDTTPHCRSVPAGAGQGAINSRQHAARGPLGLRAERPNETILYVAATHRTAIFHKVGKIGFLGV